MPFDSGCPAADITEKNIDCVPYMIIDNRQFFVSVEGW